MPQKTVYGIVDFLQSILCQAEVLGKSIDICITKKYQAKLIFPSAREKEKDEYGNLKLNNLVAPLGKSWKRGNNYIYWGTEVSRHEDKMNADVERALLKFVIDSDKIEIATQEVYKGFTIWLKLFHEYIILLTGQYRSPYISVSKTNLWRRLELIIDEQNSPLRTIHPSSSFIKSHSAVVIISPPNEEEYLNLEILNQVCQLSSQGLPPRLEYRLLLEAYNARQRADWRKSIIEVATALEVCLTQRLEQELETRGISFGRKLLDRKFRMLSGRFELIRLLDLEIPDKDYKNLIIEPRNRVMHKGNFIKQTANKAIEVVEELLKIFSPQIYEDKPET